MTNNEVLQCLQCYIDLSLFDSFSGESLNKECLDKKVQRDITACEEAIKLMSGYPEESLEMSANNIADVLISLKKELDNHISEIIESGHGENNPVITDETFESEAFSVVIEKITNGEYKNIQNHERKTDKGFDKP